MNEADERRTISIRVAVGIAIASALLTWLCVSWVGTQGPLTAGVAVLLVELFLACFVAIAVLLAARLSDSYPKSEARRTEADPPSSRMWLWRPIWLPAQGSSRRAELQFVQQVSVADWLQAVYEELRPLSESATRPDTIRLSIPVAPAPDSPQHSRSSRPRVRRAA